MEETKVRDNSKAITFATYSSPPVEKMELSTIQDINVKPSAKKMKKWFSSSQDDTTTCCCCNISPKVVKCLELSGLIAVIVIVVMLFIIPIISHFVQEMRRTQHNINIPDTTNTTNCSQQDLSWSVVPDVINVSQCCAKPYTGNACSSFLSNWQTCALGQSTSVFVHNTSLLSEDQVTKLIINIAQHLNSYSSCKRTGLPFLCQYVFPLCDCKTGDLYLSSQETCEEVSTVACRTLWPLLEQAIQPLKLPDCSTLPMATYPPDMSGSGNSDISPTTGTSSLPQDTVCDDQFVKINGTCYARCDSFEQSPHDVTVTLKSVRLFAACYGFIVGIVVLILSFVRWKTMLIFPSVFLVYMTAGYCIFGNQMLCVFFSLSLSLSAIFVFASQIDRSNLYCNSVAITKENFNNSTIFCHLAGAVFHYFVLNITLWWFFHVCSIFYKVMFPLTAKQYEKKEKYFHIVLLVTGIFIPIPGVLLAFLIPDLGYVVNEFPPFLCTPQNQNLWYYSANLPLNILIAIGVIYLVLMFRKLHKHEGIFRTRKKSSLGISTAEKKILFVLCYYVIFAVIMLVYFRLATAGTDSSKEALETYLRCQALGHLPNQTSQCDPKEYQQYIYPELAAATYFLMGFLTTANLTFVINWSTVAKFCSRYFCKQKKSSNVMLPNPHLPGGNDVTDSSQL